MQWSHFPMLPDYEFVTGKLRKRLEDFREAHARLMQNRASFDARQQKHREADVAQLDFDDFVMLPTDRAHAVMILQEELQLREQYVELDKEIRQAARSAIDKAFEELEAARADVTAKLVEIGYVEAEPNVQAIGKIIPGDVAKHPKVHAARQRLTSLQNQRQDTAIATKNLAAISQLREKLEAIRDSASKV